MRRGRYHSPGWHPRSSTAACKSRTPPSSVRQPKRALDLWLKISAHTLKTSWRCEAVLWSGVWQPPRRRRNASLAQRDPKYRRHSRIAYCRVCFLACKVHIEWVEALQRTRDSRSPTRVTLFPLQTALQFCCGWSSLTLRWCCAPQSRDATKGAASIRRLVIWAMKRPTALSRAVASRRRRTMLARRRANSPVRFLRTTPGTRAFWPS